MAEVSYLLPRGCDIPALPAAYRLVLCEWCSVLFLTACMMPTEGAQPLLVFLIIEHLNWPVSPFTSSSHSFGSGPYFSGAFFTIQLIQQLNRKAALNNNSETQRACSLLSMYRLITQKYASAKQAPSDWCVSLWTCNVHEWLCHVSVSIPVWAMSSMLGVSVRACWGSMRMSPQHFFAKDRYLWTMLCLCCKLALPTTRKRELISFFMYNKCKPDSSGLNIIADTMLYEISSCSVSYLYFPDLHC